MTESNKIQELKTTMAKSINVSSLSGEEKRFIIKWLELEVEESNLYDIMKNISIVFKMEPEEYRVTILPEELEYNNTKEVMRKTLELVCDKFGNIALEDIYLIKLTLHLMDNVTDILLNQKLISIYNDIRYSKRELVDIMLDLVLINNYENQILQGLINCFDKEIEILSR